MTDCLFCRIIEGKEPSVRVYEDDHSIAFMDRYPINNGHTLVAPKKHYDLLTDMPPEDVGRLFTSVARIVKAVQKATSADGVNVGQANGRAAAQEVFHVHVHVIPRFVNDSTDGRWPHRKNASMKELEKAGKAIMAELNSPP